VVKLFREAFADSIRHYFGCQTPRRSVYTELFSFLFQAEPGAFRVAVEDEQVIGYVITPSSIIRLYQAALQSGFIWRLTWGTISGSYGLSLRAVLLLIVDKLRLGLSPVVRDFRGAQILSIAVAPAARGRGAASALLAQAVDYLSRRGVRRIKLEVRPENTAALHLYRKFGFEQVGQACDSRGPWVVMFDESNSPVGKRLQKANVLGEEGPVNGA